MKNLYTLFWGILLMSCSTTTIEPLKVGNWGGDHVRLEVTETSWYIELDCAHAEVTMPVTLNEGTFETSAKYYQEYGAPIEDPEMHKAKEATIKGSLVGNVLTFTIYVGSEQTNYGTYSVEWNKEPMVYKCA